MKNEQLKISTIMPSQHEIDEYAILGLSISPEEVLFKNFESVNNFMECLYKSGSHARSKAMITFDYDSTSKEIYQIQEVRDYVKQLYLNHKNLFYYIHLGSHENFLILMLCLFKIVRATPKDNKTTSIAVQPDKAIIREIIINLESYARKLNDTDLVGQEKILDKIQAIIKN